MKLIAPEDVCIRGQAIIQNSRFTRKLFLQAKSFVDLRNRAAHRREIRVFSAFCLRLRAGYAERGETIRLNSLRDPEKKIVSDRESTISPAIANSRDYSRRNQKASALLKIWRRDPFVSSTTRNTTAKSSLRIESKFRAYGTS